MFQAWLEGAKIQEQWAHPVIGCECSYAASSQMYTWRDIDNPNWKANNLRIKPKQTDSCGCCKCNCC